MANSCPIPPYFFEGHALQQAKSILDYDLKPVRNLYAGSSHGGDGRDSQLWRFGGRHGRFHRAPNIIIIIIIIIIIRFPKRVLSSKCATKDKGKP